MRTSRSSRNRQLWSARKCSSSQRAAAWLLMLGSLSLGGCFSAPPPSESPPAVESESPDKAESKGPEAATDRAAEEAPPKQAASETGSSPDAAENPEHSATQKSAPRGASPNDKPAESARQSGLGRSQTTAGDFASSAGKEADSKLSLAESARVAAQMREKARELQSTNPGQAFEAALRGWQLTSRFPDDPVCAAMHGEFGRMLDLLGTQANSVPGGSVPPLRSDAETIIE